MKPFQPLVWLFLATVSACAGPASNDTGGDANVLVILHDFKNGQQLELASESHTDRVQYYSEQRGDAVRKVVIDPVMSACLGELERLGYDEYEKSGRVPNIGASEVVRWGLEVESHGERTYWLVGTGSPADEWKAFQSCRDLFLELYNNTVSYQAVRNADGSKFFDDERGRSAGKP